MPTPLQQAITAIKAGDKPASQRWLAQALQENPCDETAWVWMSALVETDAQRRDCLTRVLAINPNNETARRGLEKLSRLAAPQPTRQPSDYPTDQRSISPVFQRFQPPAVWPPPAPDAPIDEPVRPEAPKPSLVPSAASLDAESRQVATEFVVKELSRSQPHSDIVVALCNRYTFDWKEAEKFIRKVEAEKGRSIAARQSPLVLVIGIGTVLAGLALGAYGLLELLNGVVAIRFGFIFDSVWIPTPVMIITGLGMIAGGAYGTFRALGKLRR